VWIDHVLHRKWARGKYDSEGCFAVAGSALPELMAKLGPGRLLYADNVSEVG
jgi:hypothetical protein